MLPSFYFFNFLQSNLYQGIENLISISIGIISLLLLALSISAYQKTGLKQIKYAIIIFALFAIQLFFDFLENTFSTLDIPEGDIIFSSLTLAILVLFFFAIVSMKVS
jgi:hypothetical protein